MLCKQCGINELKARQEIFCSKACRVKNNTNVEKYKTMKDAWGAWTPQCKLIHKALTSVDMGLISGADLLLRDALLGHSCHKRKLR